jgi:hypothetical protein
MFHESLSDPTAGQRAQQTRLNPGLPQPILDPTDPRCGTTAAPKRDEASDAHRPAVPGSGRPGRASG